MQGRGSGILVYVCLCVCQYVSSLFTRGGYKFVIPIIRLKNFRVLVFLVVGQRWKYFNHENFLIYSVIPTLLMFLIHYVDTYILGVQ